ncbi:U3 small nucleolar ribonucleoprotein IMP3 [Spironucleus salmonicida]|uniref:U3 small nucleolar ribonucleoprotein IMP3 n=1 Tax=Spironucleus salmonicida TaxID=348837 RepID=V6LM58_9EUKA|nr:U3 small nucleolar ribonucleoprotein IMP3 [Spironucleus salmonicida]|eukprot:EST45730.1 U3 small nucleolar ribonucleoprotein IMP3 [Spironucleus salmonicida]
MRKLKYHEKKLLKHSDPFSWDTDRNMNIYNLMGKYCIRSDQQALKYLQTAKKVKSVAEKLTELPKNDEVRRDMTQRLAKLLFELGVSQNPIATLEELSKFSGEQIMKRRLPSLLYQLKMADTTEIGGQYIDHGHVRVGPTIITDVNFHVAKGMEDFITWRNDSSIRKKIMKYNDEIDDYELQQ